MSRKTVGMLAVMAAAMMWAVEPVVARHAYKTSGFVETTTVRAMITTILAFIHLAGTGGLRSLCVGKEHIPKLIFLGIAGTAVADLLYLYSFTVIPILNSVLIGHMQPIFIILLGLIFFREEKLTGGDLLFIIFMMLAGILITTKNPENFRTFKLGTFGDLLVLISAVLWAMSGIVAKKYLTELTVGAIVFYRFLIASVILVLIALKYGDLGFDSPYQIASGIIVFTGYMLYYEGLKRLKTAITSSLELTAPLFASVLGYVFFKESITGMQVFGLFLVLVAIIFIKHSE